MSQTTLVFVYGTLKTGFPLNHTLQRTQSKFVGEARILNKNFVMRDLGYYPALQKVHAGSAPSYIHGELWEVNLLGLTCLDKVEGYPGNYSRTQTTVWVGDSTYSAWVYYIDHAHTNKQYIWNAPVVQSGKWEKPLGMGQDHSESIWPDDLFQPDNDSQEYNGSDDNMGELIGDDICNFFVEPGVYITSNHGDHYGPYDTINEAIAALSNLGNEVKDNKIDTFTVGFRVVREGLTDQEAKDLAESTIPF